MDFLQTTVSSQGQIFLPRRLREKYDVEEGDKFLIFPKEKDTILLKRIPKQLFKATFGILKEEIEREGGVEKAHKKWEEEWEKVP